MYCHQFYLKKVGLASRDIVLKFKTTQRWSLLKIFTPYHTQQTDSIKNFGFIERVDKG